MKKYLLILVAAFGLLLSAQVSAQSKYDNEDYDAAATAQSSKLNNKRLEKNLEKYAQELQLTKKQIKRIAKIDRKYARKERRLSRKRTTKKRDIRALQERERTEMIQVLTYDQQKKLEGLSKRGFFDFLRSDRR